MRITDEIEIGRNPQEVYSRFADLTFWHRALTDVLAVEILYDDGLRQEFRMCVGRPTGPETVRGVRFCSPCHRIEVFQPEPPPGLARLCGVWEFEAVGVGTRVTARRDALVHPGTGEDEARARLSVALRRNLVALRAAVEAM